MEKFKICPTCQTKNPPSAFECSACETDLTSEKITDTQTENMLAQRECESQESAPSMVRVCECGTQNASNARKCTACGEDIGDILPTPAVACQPCEPPTLVLSSLDGVCVYRVPSESVDIGREREMSEYLSTKLFVSSEHARLLYTADGWMIEHLSKTNATYLNDRVVSGTALLTDGDELGLGGNNAGGTRQELAAYFLVRIS